MEEEKLEKSYYRIRHVAEMLGVSQSTIRFWEKEFPSCRPSRSRSGRRLYTPEDINHLRTIHFLLKVRGLKIEAAREQMRANPSNVSQRMEIISRLEGVKEELSKMLKALNMRKV